MLPRGPCPIPDDVCCTTLFDAANYLLCALYEPMRICTHSNNCTPIITGYVTLGVGDDGVTDALTVAVGPTAPSPGSFDRATGRQVGTSLYRTTYRVMLRESGWPMAHVEGNDVVAPDPVDQHALARHAYAHGEQLLRLLERMRYDRTMHPTDLSQPSIAALGPLVPLLPQGGTIGFYIDVQLDMLWPPNA